MHNSKSSLPPKVTPFLKTTKLWMAHLIELLIIFLAPCPIACFVHPLTDSVARHTTLLRFWPGKCTMSLGRVVSCVRPTTGGIAIATAAKFTDDHQEALLDQGTPKINNKKNPPLVHPKRSRPRLAILAYEGDAGWVGINKPAGMTLHRGSQQTRRRELVVATTLKRQLSRKVFPVHRLDHRTSGVLLFAFSSEMASILHSALRDHRLCEKTYVALLRGDWDQHYETEQITIDKPLEVHGIAKDSKTVFRKLAVGTITMLSDRNNTTNKTSCTLVAASPQTGRTHQIRRHAATSLGMPILGDTQHGDSKMNRWWRHQIGLNRLALHCLAVKQLHIISSSSLQEHQQQQQRPPPPSRDIVAPLPDNLKSIFLQRDELAAMWHAAVAKEPLLASEWIDHRGGTRGIVKDWQKKSCAID